MSQQEKTDWKPINPSLDIEKMYWQRGLLRVAGVDEAGRGCLAGPVVAACVLFAPDVILPGVQDSKQLSAARRAAAAEAIRGQALAVGVGQCSPAEVDRLNILHAALEAMRRAVLDMGSDPDVVLIDGNRSFKHSPWVIQTVVGGDARSHGIAAASIIAKTVRDGLMRELHEQHPDYGWDQNAGYPTKAHYAALRQHGPTPHHRRSFRLQRDG